MTLLPQQRVGAHGLRTHVQALGILHIIFGGIGILVGVALFLFFGGIAGLIALTSTSDDVAVASPLLGVIGFFVLAVMIALSLPGIVAGFGLLSYKGWARILMLILSVLHLFNFPFGTALGVYGLWVLLSADVTAAFTSGTRNV